MSTCYSVIARETLVFPPRWKRHLIENGVCQRCLQPEFVKQKGNQQVTEAMTTPPSKSFIENLAVFPEQVDTTKEILGLE